MAENTAAEALCARLQTAKLPRWEELPDLELYMDQVLALIKKYLAPYPGFDENGLTASMVNNYVKAGILPAPVKKRYSRRHLARLLPICLLKSSLPIAEIRRLWEAFSETEEPTLYDCFCALAEQSAREAVSALQQEEGGKSIPALVLCAALRAHAEQTVAQSLCAQLTAQKPES